jgi:hypothetical protein
MSFLDSAYSKINTPTVPEPVQLGYSTNNVYANFPPLMSDGRSVLSTHQPESATNNYLLEKLNIQSNWEYRQYLQNNALDIMKFNSISMSNDVGYIHRFDDYTNDPTAPAQYTSMSDNVRSKESDLMNVYMTREELQKKLE